jgi:bacillithiol biosynthesis cysteine-adding enzyme BshC
MLKYRESISFGATQQFPKLFLDYLNELPQLKEFYSFKPDISGFRQQIEKRRGFPQEYRKNLKNHLNHQYSDISLHVKVKKNIDLLEEENTYTLCTGHQLNLFTGPLYFIYKVLTVINLSEELKKEFPKENFVPVYWMASEDHDFEEIQYFNHRGKKHQWDSKQKGAVGRFNTNDIQGFLDSIPFDFKEIKKFYTESKTLAQAHLKLVNHLFQDYGLVVLDADSKVLKTEFSSIIRNDIEDEIAFSEVNKSTAKLNKLIYSTPVNPRQLNYFILGDQFRYRLEKDQNGVFYLDVNEKRVDLDINHLLEESPESISPNVITRPIYQECILPNLAYIGGPSELSYWLQLKSAFQGLGINFPLLIHRYSNTVLSDKAIEKLKQIKIEDLSEIFQNESLLLKQLLIRNELIEEDLHKEWEKSIENVFNDIKSVVSEIDKTLIASAEGRHKKVNKEILKIRKKIESAILKKQDTLTARLNFAKSEVFPNGSFQERYDNIFELLEENSEAIHELKNLLPSALDMRHHLIEK